MNIKFFSALLIYALATINFALAQMDDPTGGQMNRPEMVPPMEKPMYPPATGYRNPDAPVSDKKTMVPPRPMAQPPQNEPRPYGGEGRKPYNPSNSQVVDPMWPPQERTPSPGGVPEKPSPTAPRGVSAPKNPSAREAGPAGMQNNKPLTPPPGEVKEMREDIKQVREQFRDNVRDARQDFRDDMKDMRDKMKGERRMPDLPPQAMEAIAKRLGTTPEELKTQLDSGVKLRDLVKDKIKPEEMKQILPPRTEIVERKVEEKGFFGRLRSGIFGERKEKVEQTTDEFGEVTTAPTAPATPDKPFWRRVFGL